MKGNETNRGALPEIYSLSEAVHMFDEPPGSPYDWPSELERRTPRLGYPYFWGILGHGPELSWPSPGVTEMYFTPCQTLD